MARITAFCSKGKINPQLLRVMRESNAVQDEDCVQCNTIINITDENHFACIYKYMYRMQSLKTRCDVRQERKIVV